MLCWELVRMKETKRDYDFEILGARTQTPIIIDYKPEYIASCSQVSLLDNM
jgi:hypothetical protein